MNLIKKILHILVKRDVKSNIYTNGFGYFGNSSVLYKPLYIKPKKSIFVGERTTILNGSRIQTFNDLTGLDAKIIIGDDCYENWKRRFNG